ncbi:hypothetical protein NRIC_08560 [Enterococcus florum]|uniref:DUF1722 domain-containing protein n=1 Tax=Enterococcus florum TaxID=2480627 RepID=A0A4P5P559_9ENTE|nr:DUF1722 domain-containing protein [Enterococcus florum]GCF92965.1 hypothetical protein NRIC_08560 [Enterococcus florum]
MEFKEKQKEWAAWKYFVMARSQKEYLYLRGLFSGNQWSSEKTKLFNEALKRVQKMPENSKAKRNAYEHVWGYFKKQASDQEREVFFEKLAGLSDEQDEVLSYLKKLNQKYRVPYLQSSKLFKE